MIDSSTTTFNGSALLHPVDRPAPRSSQLSTVADTERALADTGYLADRGLATAILVALQLGRPLLLEGEPGVGKTMLAEALTQMCDAELIRLQCYEGIESSQALYDWDFPRQLLAARSMSDSGEDYRGLYTPEFLLERSLLRALRLGSRAVLLIDELDRADDEFEAFLLEFLSDFAVTVPEIGRVSAPDPPIVVITSNRTRELHDALTRRCLYHWIDYPDVEREVAIISMHVPDAAGELARSVAETTARMRSLDLLKPPGAAESIDWTRALRAVGVQSLRQNAELGRATLGAVAKNRDDLRRLDGLMDELVNE